MHEEDERPRNENPHANYFSITYNGCEYCLLIHFAIVALPKCQIKGCRLFIRGFICPKPWYDPCH